MRDKLPRAQWIGVALTCVLLTPVIAAELKLRPPAKPFGSYPRPEAPDYAMPAAWAVWPGRPSPADQVPSGLEGTVAQDPKADVFFVHPTTYLTNTTWNAAYNEGGFTGEQLEQGVLRHQVSTFNGCCRIYAPRYRQATLSAFLSPGGDANQAFSVAYSDVERAFDYYIEHENNGRPFILASHSQGSLHATRLLQQRVVNNPEIRKRLIVAYVVGAALPDEPDYTALPLCSSALQTGCLVDWNGATLSSVLALGHRRMVSFSNGKYELVGNKPWVCVNPLSWDLKSITPASANSGSLPIGKKGEPMPALIPNVTGARCERGRLVINIPAKMRKGFTDVLTLVGSYHNQDYNLFYASIRQNAIDRVNAFLDASQQMKAGQ